MVKYHNSCYRSYTHGQNLLCLQLREDVAYGSTQWKMTHLSSLCVKTADNCDKSYWKLSFDTQIQVPFTITESQPSSIKLPTVDYGSGSSRNRKLRQWRQQRQGKRHLKNKHLPSCGYFTIAPSCSRSTMLAKFAKTKLVYAPKSFGTFEKQRTGNKCYTTSSFEQK